MLFPFNNAAQAAFLRAKIGVNPSGQMSANPLAVIAKNN